MRETHANARQYQRELQGLPKALLVANVLEVLGYGRGARNLGLGQVVHDAGDEMEVRHDALPSGLRRSIA